MIYQLTNFSHSHPQASNEVRDVAKASIVVEAVTEVFQTMGMQLLENINVQGAAAAEANAARKEVEVRGIYNLRFRPLMIHAIIHLSILSPTHTLC